MGNISSKLNSVFDAITQKKQQLRPEESHKAFQKDIEAFVNEYSQNNIFDFSSGRRLHSFPHFKYPLTKIHKLVNLKGKLQKYSEAFDDLQLLCYRNVAMAVVLYLYQTILTSVYINETQTLKQIILSE